MALQEARILHGVTFYSCERLCSVRHAGRVAEIDEAFVWETFVEGAIHCESAYAAVEDTDGKVAIQMIRLLGLFEDL